MFNQLGSNEDDIDYVELDLAHVDKILEDIDDFLESYVGKLFKEDLELIRRRTLDGIVDTPPETFALEKIREQMIGECRTYKQMLSWFTETRQQLLEYKANKEQEIT